MAAVPLAEGVDDRLFVNGAYDHDPLWPTVQCPHEPLQHLEYDQVRRGRVIFNKTENCFSCDLDYICCTATITQMLIAHVHLTRPKTIFKLNRQDTTDPNDLDQ